MLLLAAISPDAKPAFAHHEDPIPASDLFRQPSFEQVRISPDGRFLSVIVSVEKAGGAHNLAILPVDDPRPEIITGYRDNYDVTWHRWAGDDDLVFALHYGREEEGDGVGLQGYYRVELPPHFRSDAEGSGTRPAGNFRVQRPGKNGVALWADQGGETPRYAYRLSTPRAVRDRFLVNGYALSGAGPDGWWIDTTHARAELAARYVPGTLRWLSDHDGEVRMGFGFQDDGDRLAVVRHRKGGEWRPVLTAAMDDVEPQGFDGPTGALLIGHRREDRAGLWRYDADGAVMGDALAADPVYDVALAPDAVRFDDRGRPLWVTYQAERPARIFLDSAWARRQARVDEALAGTHNTLVDWDVAEERFVVLATSEREPGAYYLYEEASNEIRFLLRTMPWLEPGRLASARPVSFEARDGLRLHGYLTRPEGEAGTTAPLIVLNHASPFEGRNRWGFDPQVQFLASRGYAVLQVDYRGSTGYGRAFQAAGRGQWGRAMLRDVEDAVDWAVRTGEAKPGQVCLMGAGYGGYTALLAASEGSGRYRCAVSYGGYVDLPDLYDREMRTLVPIRRQRRAAWWRDRFGDQMTEDGTVVAPSPIDPIDALDAAVLVIHGRGVSVVSEGPASIHRLSLPGPPRGPQQFIGFRGGGGRLKPYRRVQYQDYVAALRRSGKIYEAMDARRERGAHRVEASVALIYQRVASFLERHLPVTADPPPASDP